MGTTRRTVAAGAVAAGAAASGILAFRASEATAGPGDNGRDRLFNDPALPVQGNAMGRIALVEFFDYRCPYCHTMLPVLHELLARRNDVRLVLREWPIFGGVSVVAARVALASNWQRRYGAVHEALFALGRGMDAASVRQAAANAGVDLAQLDRDMAERSRELDEALGDTTVLAHSLGFQGTPCFVSGRYKAIGALTLSELERMIPEAAGQG